MKFEDIELIINEVKKLENHIEILSIYSKRISKIITKANNTEQGNAPYIKILKSFRHSLYSSIRTSKIAIMKYNEEMKQAYLNDKESEDN